MKIYHVLFFLMILSTSLAGASISITPCVEFNITNATIGFTENFEFDNVIVKNESLCMLKSEWSNLTVYPTNNITINISRWDTSGDYQKTFYEEAEINTTVTDHYINGFNVNSLIYIDRDGAPYISKYSDNYGILSFSYDDGYSSHTFDIYRAGELYGFGSIEVYDNNATGNNTTIIGSRYLAISPKDDEWGYNGSDIYVPASAIIGVVTLIILFGYAINRLTSIRRKD